MQNVSFKIMQAYMHNFHLKGNSKEPMDVLKVYFTDLGITMVVNHINWLSVPNTPMFMFYCTITIVMLISPGLNVF